MLFDKDKFRDSKELHAFLVEHKSSLIAKKKAAIKKADGIHFGGVAAKSNINKAVVNDKGYIDISPIINTTNLLDSHKDLHLPKIWNRSIKSPKYRILNKEHKQGFEDIIAEGMDVNAVVKTLEWAKIGFNYKGETEALIYNSKIYPTVNPFMYKRYAENKVRNHSVEMFYVNLELCINDQQYKEEFAAYNKYFPMMVNEEDEDEGYFWAVKEAKEIGGAAVPRGSNFATPVYEQDSDSQKITRENNNDSSDDAQTIDYSYLAKNFKLK